MFSFLFRRLLSSVIVVLISTFVMYVLVSYSIDPLEDLRTSTSPNKEQLIAGRTAALNLDTSPVVRYFDWLKGASGCLIGNCELGTAWRTGQQVTDQLSGAIVTTLQLVTAATFLAIFLGVAVGIVSALRQYSPFDYGITFVSFLLYSLPVFWVAVLMKQYLAIGFNDFLRDPSLSWTFIILATVVGALIWMAAVGGSGKRRLQVLGISAAVIFAVLVYIDATDWISDPSIGIVVMAISAIGVAYGMTALSTGLRNRKALFSALTVAGIGIVLFYPMQYFFFYVGASWPIMIGLGILSILVGIAVGYLWGGPDRAQSARTAAFTAIPVAGLIFIDRVLAVWNNYTALNVIKGRPIATIGPSTPNLEGSFFIETLDSFTHLLLPTVTLVLISFAGYTRYSRASMLEVMNQDYIRTARAKGLTERTVVMRHAFRNSLIPLASIIPVDIITLVGGAILTETIFNWRGMGRLFVTSLGNAEINPIMAYLVIVAILAVVANFVADIIYSVLDPRIRVNA